MKYLRILWEGLIPNNPVFILALGLCSTLAVTLKVENAFFMAVMVGVTTVASSVAVAFVRYRIPFRFRLLSYMLIIVTVVIAVEQSLRALFPEVARALGPYVGLIVTNCVVMGRLEAFAASHRPLEAFFDALGVAFGYAAVLLSIASIRELLGNATLWGLRVAPDFYIPCRVFNSPPGAFIVFAALLVVVNWLRAMSRRQS
ncbi:MAG: NADH:ubiquinone reductase (Na(+)-transporting) subunit D [Candidatus Riflebacteria bacterium HGW-Riflebacteria-2]|jgi:Na+-transporting NADH:ubiquinone oxidoreductase subunit D|nr:MAG: NADH:ubiquinone reductase (Na(+)-transporting) subunit D [Candidatus Riflebacteria bacterium HGW-Riflebacteria-2]